MIFPEISYEEWIQKYPDLVPSDKGTKINLCSKCKGEIIPKIPYIKKGYVGVMSDHCEHCKHQTWSYISITNSKESYDRWTKLN